MVRFRGGAGRPRPASTGDRGVLEHVLKHGCDNEEYSRFENDVAAAVRPILLAWLLPPFLIFGRVHQHLKGRGPRPTSEELEALRTDPHLRESIADATIAVALRGMRQGLPLGGWNPDGGMTLQSYFVGRLLYHFPNEYRAAKRDHTPFSGLVDDLVREAGSAEHPNDQVAAELREVERSLESESAEVRLVVHLTWAEGYSRAAVAEMTGMTAGRVRTILEGWLQKMQSMNQNESRES